jgi:two-component system response regulator AtoC
VTQGRILVIDDDQLQRWAMRKHLSSWDYDVIEAEDGGTGVEAFATHLPDLVLLDLQLGDQTGVDVLRQIKAIDPQAVVIMVTAHAGVQEAVAAFKLGLFDFLSKPLDFEALAVTLRYGVEARRLRAEVQRLKEGERHASEDTLVSESPASKEAARMLRKLAASGATTVLFTGESGTGKDMYARVLHHSSPRAAGPFIPVNCAAIPDTLLESELFGHERGAFTDARSLRKGVFELADGGTLYLDEVGELRISLQAKLLRVLESLTFRRVGGTTDVSVDVRVVAATNRDLELAVQQGEFRADLLYRLRVIEMRLRPLRERREDIPGLVRQFLKEFAVRFHKSVPVVSKSTMDVFCRYDWPGNVRELKNALERATILSEGDDFDPTCLPEQLLRTAPSLPPAGDNEFVLPSGGTSLERVEEQLVRQAIARAGGNQTRAAQLLDISRDALRYKLKKFAIES